MLIDDRMAGRIKYVLVALHVLNALVVTIRAHAVMYCALIEKEVRENDARWNAIVDLTLWPMLGLWGAVISLAMFAAMRKLFSRRESRKYLVYAVFGPPLYLFIASLVFAMWSEYL